MTQSDSNSYDVIVIGAGVIGPCVATQFARQGRKVLIVERNWSEPNRIVGELLQPGGVKLLQKLGMVSSINNIDLIPSKGYQITLNDETTTLAYPKKLDFPAPALDLKYHLLGSDTNKLSSDTTLDLDSWDSSENFRGVAFRHGKFISNLRDIVKSEPNVTFKQATVNKILKDDQGKLNGIICDKQSYYGKLIVLSDGIYSKFRKELTSTAPDIGSYFISLTLYNCELPLKNHGHVILGSSHSPILIYQISPEETRILCCHNGPTLPSQERVVEYLTKSVLPRIPKPSKPSFQKLLDNIPLENYRIMPNQFLSAKQNTIPGLLVVGDALNMRHPLTGGGMTAGLNDVVLVTRLLSEVKDFLDDAAVLEKLLEFHFERKKLDTVINVLSLLLWKLFDANNRYLLILQKGCFEYFKLGGNFVDEPMSLLAGVNPSPFVLFKHFFLVLFYGIWINFKTRGLFLFPLALFELILTLLTAIFVFLPTLTAEYFG